MLSGTLSTSCMTTPHSSRRFCSLFSFFAYIAPATSVRHVAATKYFFITDLHGQTFYCVRFTSDQIFHRRAFKTLTSREGDALPDSQAGNFCGLELRGFLGSKDDQCDSACQCKSTEDWRNGNSVMFFCCGVDRPDIQNLFLVRVRESLIREGQGSKNDKKNSNPNNRFHTFHLRCYFSLHWP